MKEKKSIIEGIHFDTLNYLIITIIWHLILLLHFVLSFTYNSLITYRILPNNSIIALCSDFSFFISHNSLCVDL
jgi:hypothetical protein